MNDLPPDQRRLRDGPRELAREAAAQAKVFASEMAIRVTNAALQVRGAAGYSKENPVERYLRDARMFAIPGGTAQVLRTQVAEQIRGRKLPQTGDGWLTLIAAEGAAGRAAAG